jgi:hypothetical protein
MGVFMKHHRPWIFRRHVEHDEVSVGPTLKEACDLSRFSSKYWGDLAHFLCVAEGDDLERDRDADLGLRHQGSKDRAHLLEAHGNFTTALFPSIRDYRKIGRTHFNPLRLARGSVRLKDEREGQGQRNEGEAKT